MKKIPSGFTIVEPMIVVAIVGVIASIAIPIYTDYMTRAKVAEALTLMGGLKNPLVDRYDDLSEWPSIADISGKTTGRYTSTIKKGQLSDDLFYLEATMKSIGDIGGKKLRMTYTPSSRNWTCTVNGITDPIPDKFLPAYCRTAE